MNGHGTGPSSRTRTLALLTLALLCCSARAQVRKDKVYIDDGASNFTILKSDPLGGASQNIFFPNTGGAGGTVILDYSPSGQTINHGLRVNGGLTLGTMLAPQYGGTGLDGSAAPDGSLLIGNGSGYELNTITGTDDQVIVTNGPGTITLSTPQDIGTTSAPTFGGMTVNGTLTVNGELRGAGVNHFAGTVPLSASVTRVVVNSTLVQANSSIILTYEDLNDQDFVDPRVVAKSAGTSFTISFSGPIPSGANASVHYLIVNP